MKWKVILLLALGLVAVLLTAVLAGGMLFYGQAQQTADRVADAAKLEQAHAELLTLSTQVRAYEMINGQRPTTAEGLTALVQRPSISPLPRWKPLLETIPVDPWGAEYVYRSPGAIGTREFDLYSKGPDGRDGTGDDVGNY